MNPLQWFSFVRGINLRRSTGHCMMKSAIRKLRRIRPAFLIFTENEDLILCLAMPFENRPLTDDYGMNSIFTLSNFTAPSMKAQISLPATSTLRLTFYSVPRNLLFPDVAAGFQPSAVSKTSYIYVENLAKADYHRSVTKRLPKISTGSFAVVFCRRKHYHQAASRSVCLTENRYIVVVPPAFQRAIPFHFLKCRHDSKTLE